MQRACVVPMTCLSNEIISTKAVVTSSISSYLLLQCQHRRSKPVKTSIAIRLMAIFFNHYSRCMVWSHQNLIQSAIRTIMTFNFRKFQELNINNKKDVFGAQNDCKFAKFFQNQF